MFDISSQPNTEWGPNHLTLRILIKRESCFQISSEISHTNRRRPTDRNDNFHRALLFLKGLFFKNSVNLPLQSCSHPITPDSQGFVALDDICFFLTEGKFPSVSSYFFFFSISAKIMSPIRTFDWITTHISSWGHSMHWKNVFFVPGLSLFPVRLT